MNDNVIPINKNSKQYFPTAETLMMLQIIETNLKQWEMTQRSGEDVFFVECYLQEVLANLNITL